MEPIYFPFTAISESALARFVFWDAAPVIYGPTNTDISSDLATLIDAGRINRRVPVTADQDKLQGMLKAYHDWAGQHAGAPGGLTAFKTAQGDGAPFFDDTYITSIRSAINKAPQNRPADAHHGEHLFQARLFLLMAQRFDAQNEGLHKDLDTLIQMERLLYKELKGFNEQADIHGLPVEDRGVNMTAARIKAWSRLFLADSRKKSAIFVTDSPAVFEYLLEFIPTLKPAFSLKNSGRFAGDGPEAVSQRKKLEQLLSQLVCKADMSASDGLDLEIISDDIDSKNRLTIAVAPGMSPTVFFETCLEGNSTGHTGPISGAGSQATLIGLVG